VTADRRGNRLGEAHPRGSHRRDAVGIGSVAVRAAHGLEIGAGAERAARAEQHGDGRVRVRIEVAERLGERRCRRPVHGVTHLGTVQDDGRHWALPLDPNGHP
jgi:hypothetical protein